MRRSVIDQRNSNGSISASIAVPAGTPSSCAGGHGEHLAPVGSLPGGGIMPSVASPSMTSSTGEISFGPMMAPPSGMKISAAPKPEKAAGKTGDEARSRSANTDRGPASQRKTTRLISATTPAKSRERPRSRGEHQVHVLHGRTRGALAEIVEQRHEIDLLAAGVPKTKSFIVSLPASSTALTRGSLCSPPAERR
jgi:hypothetical protein